MNDLASSSELIAFWFGPPDPAAGSAAVAARQAGLWWGKDARVDQQISARFASTMRAALEHRLDAWADTPHGMLALILLLDQLPRNSYRDTPQSFASDELARQCCHLALAQGFDQQLPPLQRVFMYLPLQHSEDLDDQQQCVQLFAQLARTVARAEPAAKACFDDYLRFARRHCEIIERFGRFPHRNAVLRRASTAAENVFLQEPNSSF